MAMPASSRVPMASWPWRPTIATSTSVVDDAAEEGRKRQARRRRTPWSSGAASPLPSAMVATAASAAPEDTPIRPGIGQRIAEHALHHGAGHGQRRAHEHAEQQARQADVEQHQLLARAGGVVLPGGDGGQHARQRGQRDAGRADGERTGRRRPAAPARRTRRGRARSPGAHPHGQARRWAARPSFHGARMRRQPARRRDRDRSAASGRGRHAAHAGRSRADTGHPS